MGSFGMTYKILRGWASSCLSIGELTTTPNWRRWWCQMGAWRPGPQRSQFLFFQIPLLLSAWFHGQRLWTCLTAFYPGKTVSKYTGGYIPRTHPDCTDNNQPQQGCYLWATLCSIGLDCPDEYEIITLPQTWSLEGKAAKDIMKR